METPQPITPKEKETHRQAKKRRELKELRNVHIPKGGEGSTKEGHHSAQKKRKRRKIDTEWERSQQRLVYCKKGMAKEKTNSLTKKQTKSEKGGAVLKISIGELFLGTESKSIRSPELIGREIVSLCLAPPVGGKKDF